MPRERYDPVRAFVRSADGHPVHMATVYEIMGSPKPWSKDMLIARLRDRHGVEVTQTIREVPWIVAMKLNPQPKDEGNGKRRTPER